MGDDIFKLVDSEGLPLAIVLVILWIMWSLLRRKFTTWLTNSNHPATPPVAHQITNAANLSYHRLFTNSQYRLTVEIPNLDLGGKHIPVKQQMFRDLLCIFVKSVYDGCYEIAEYDMDLWSSEKWVNEINKKMNEIIINFNMRCRSEGIPEVVLYKFSKWNQETVENMYESISMVAQSSMYESNTARVNTLFLLMDFLIVMSISDAEKTLTELNGEVAGKLYKGLTIED